MPPGNAQKEGPVDDVDRPTPPARLGDALSTLLEELVDGARRDAAYVLNPRDPGMLLSIARLDAKQASAAPAGGGSSIAAHVDHLLYGLELDIRWSKGENPFSTADFSASWARGTVSEEEWRRLQDALGSAARRWKAVVSEERSLTDVQLKGIIASVVHLAYQLGAIRQIDRATRGPAAAD
jgi:hypothetical protein